MEAKTLRIGTRASKLALTQANSVKDSLYKSGCRREIELVVIKTKGDKILGMPLAQIGGKGLFVKEIEEALISKKIDIAVHSMKDVPSQMVPDLCIGAVTKRLDPRDVLVSSGDTILKHLSDDTVVGTSSLRRQSQILNCRPSFQIVQLRGNVETRLRRVEGGGIDVIIVAAAGLQRMGLEKQITEYLPTDLFLPAIAQGALGIQIREENSEIMDVIRPLDHQETHRIIDAERAYLAKLGGSCVVPVAGLAQIKDNIMTIEGFVGSVDGVKIIKDSISGSPMKGCQLGVTLAEKILAKGGDKILKEIFDKLNNNNNEKN